MVKLLQNILPSECTNENCIIKKSHFNKGVNCVADVKQMDLFRERQDIFFENNSVEGIYFVFKGVVKVYKANNEKNQIVRLATDGDIIGHRGLGKDSFPVSAQALTETELCFIKKDNFFDLLKESSSLATNLMLFFADELNTEESKLSNLTNYTVFEKGRLALKIMIDSFGISKDGFIHHAALLSRQEIGELVGLSANQITKILKEMQEDKWIDIQKKEIKIKKADKF